MFSSRSSAPSEKASPKRDANNTQWQINEPFTILRAGKDHKGRAASIAGRLENGMLRYRDMTDDWIAFVAGHPHLLIGVFVSIALCLLVVWLVWKPVSHSAPRKPRVRILYGTQSGTAERFSRQLASDIGGWYLDDHEVAVDSLEDVQADSMRAETLVILVMATYGDGEPTDDAAEFCQWLTTKCSDDAGVEQLLQALPFAVFGLGNKKYEHFCAAGKLAYQCMLDLGAKPIVERGDGNDGEDIDADFDGWKTGLLSAIDASGLLTRRGGSKGAGEGEQEKTAAYDVVIPDKDTHVRCGVAELVHNSGDGTKRDAPFLAEVLTVKELHAPTAERSCIHVELDVTGSDIKYTAGDHLGVFSKNGQETVEKAAKALGYPLDMAFTLVQPEQAPAHLPQPFPGPVTVADALAWHVDLLSPVSKPALQGLLALAQGQDREKLGQIVNGSAEQYKAWHKQSRCLLEVLEEFPNIQPPLGAFFASVAQKLQPRFYSISSSPAADPNVISLTCAVVRSITPTGRLHKGLSSTYLKEKLPGTRVPVFLRQSSFRLPSDPMAPLLMVGAGTGLAPYRGFLQERMALLERGTTVGPAYLFFGCRTRDQDFIYKSELEGFQKAGALTELHVAFSREGKQKDYVQHQLLRQAQTVAYMLSATKDAHGVVYVCGDAKHMAQDVAQAAVGIVMAAEGCSEETVRSRFTSMSKERRIQKDVW